MEPILIKKDRNYLKKQKRVLIISTLLVVILLISSSYAVLTNFAKVDDAITFQTGNLAISVLNGEETFSLINLNNKLPESDTSGLASSNIIPITLKNTGNIKIGTYKVKLMGESNSTLDEDYIRYAISLDNITYDTPSTLISNDNIIYIGKDLEVNQTKTIYLKIWLAETSGTSTFNNVFYGSLKIELIQYQANTTPTVSSLSDNGNGKIKFTVVSNDSEVSSYCINQSSEDTNNCVWKNAIIGEQVTSDYVNTSGTYYVHLKDNNENITHSEGLVMNLTYNVLDYLETTGTQYINTNFNPNPATTKVETIFQVTNNTVSTQGLFGSRNLTANVDNTSVNIFYNHTSNQLRLDWVGNATTTFTASLNTDINMICLNNTVTINGTNYTSNVTKSSTYLTYPIYIGNFNNAGSPYTNGAYMKIKSFKIYDNNNLVRNYIPVERKSDNVVGLYDKVENRLYTNSGTNSFVKGTQVGVL